jgi:general secretion pathway protein I
MKGRASACTVLGCHWLRQCRTAKSQGALAEPVAPLFVQAGFSLLEVILALAILAGSLAALGEVMRQADRNAALSSDETQAQIIASSIMDELISGYRPATAVNRAVYDPNVDPPWLYSIAIENTTYPELVAIRVQVEQQLEAQLQPARFELVRWQVNPEAMPSEVEEEEETEAESSSSESSDSSSSSSSSATGGSGGGP